MGDKKDPPTKGDRKADKQSVKNDHTKDTLNAPDRPKAKTRWERGYDKTTGRLISDGLINPDDATSQEEPARFIGRANEVGTRLHLLETTAEKLNALLNEQKVQPKDAVSRAHYEDQVGKHKALEKQHHDLKKLHCEQEKRVGLADTEIKQSSAELGKVKQSLADANDKIEGFEEELESKEKWVESYDKWTRS